MYSVIRSCISITLLACTLLSGCDPVRTTRQTVSLTVLDSESGEAITGAGIRLKNDFDRQEHDWPNTATEEEWESHARKNWEQAEWFHATTDENGSGTVVIEYTALKMTRENDMPPRSRDWVTNEPYLVEVSVSTARIALLSIEMIPGKKISGSGILIRIDDIRAPD